MIKFKPLSSLFILSLILILSGCEKEFNDSDTQISTDYNTVVIPSDFDYSLTKDIDITVKVDDKDSGDFHYLIEIFNSNPIINSDAILLSKGTATNKDPYYEATVTVPKTNIDDDAAPSYLYIKQTSPSGLSSVKMAEISGDNISVNFGTDTSDSKVKSITKSSSFETKGSFGEDSEIDDSGITKTYTTPAATEITASTGTLIAGANYIISAENTYTGTISFPSTGTSSTLYIEGTWTNTASSNNIYGSKIIVQSGGKITSTVASTFSMNTSALLFIADGGTFNGNNISITQNNKSGSKIVNLGVMECSDMSYLIGLYNYGTLTINSINNAGNGDSKFLNKGTLTVNEYITLHGVFQNDNTTTITGKFLADGSLGVTMINNGYFETNNLTLQKSTIHNNGRFKIDSDFITLSTAVAINIASGTIFKTKNYTASSQSTITMEENAIFEVTNKMTVNSKSYIYGPESGNYALARLETENSSSQWQNLRCSGNVEIESSNYGEKDITISGNAKFVEEGSSDITIAPTDYNLGGNIPAGGVSPGEVEFPIIESSTNVYTYLFEDCWPNLGDYDMNDIVMDIKNISYSKNADNYIESMTITAVLRADGGVYKLAGAIQLDGIEYGDISSISGEPEENLAGEVFNRNSNGTEKGQTYAVIPLFDEAHAALGAKTVTMTNTRTDGKGNTTGSKTINLTINFNENTKLSSSDLSMKKLNVFIIGHGNNMEYNDIKIKNDINCADGKRREIHLAGYAPTDLGTTSLFKTGNDNSNISDVSSLYKSTTNLIWGLAVPGSFSYPSEAKAITKAYPNFNNWATSGGTTNTDWYENPSNGYIY